LTPEVHAQAAAGAIASAPLDLLALVMGLLGGLALFLFGLDQMTAALKAVAGDRLRVLLASLTVNRFAGLLTGAFVTAVIQSSSVTTVLVVSFISSGLMSLSQAVGVILGANIGTTVTAQIVAFKVTKLAFGLLAAGFTLTFLSRREVFQHHGRGAFGLGLVFLGMTLMSEAMAPLRSHPAFLEWMVRLEAPAFGILAGTAFTALVQSSSATTAVVIAMASQGLLTLPAGIALILGANVGTCVTALLAAIGKPREAVRAALVHVLFNSLGVALWVGFIGDLAAAVKAISPGHAGLSGTALLAASVPRQIANAHTLFNVVNALVFLPLGGLLARLAERLVPDRPVGVEDEVRARYLDESLLETPTLALERVRLELARVGERVRRMLDSILPAMLSGSRVALAEVERMDEEVDRLHDHVVAYLGRISEGRLSRSETGEVAQLMDATTALENVGDVIETDLVRRGLERVDEGIAVSTSTREVIEQFHAQVAAALEDALGALVDCDAERALRVVERKPMIQRAAEAAARHQAERLIAREEGRLPAYAIETDILEGLRRIFYFAKRIAKGTIAAQQSRRGTHTEGMQRSGERGQADASAEGAHR
jgi:phosphate:Na+ symporter